MEQGLNMAAISGNELKLALEKLYSWLGVANENELLYKMGSRHFILKAILSDTDDGQNLGVLLIDYMNSMKMKFGISFYDALSSMNKMETLGFMQKAKIGLAGSFGYCVDGISTIFMINKDIPYHELPYSLDTPVVTPYGKKYDNLETIHDAIQTWNGEMLQGIITGNEKMIMRSKIRHNITQASPLPKTTPPIDQESHQEYGDLKKIAKENMALFNEVIEADNFRLVKDCAHQINSSKFVQLFSLMNDEKKRLFVTQKTFQKCANLVGKKTTARKLEKIMNTPEVMGSLSDDDSFLMLMKEMRNEMTLQLKYRMNPDIIRRIQEITVRTEGSCFDINIPLSRFLEGPEKSNIAIFEDKAKGVYSSTIFNAVVHMSVMFYADQEAGKDSFPCFTKFMNQACLISPGFFLGTNAAKIDAQDIFCLNMPRKWDDSKDVYCKVFQKFIAKGELPDFIKTITCGDVAMRELYDGASTEKRLSDIIHESKSPQNNAAGNSKRLVI